MLTHKHFEAIAAVFRQALPRDNHAVALQIALNLCVVFKAENPAFDRARFLAACGFPEE